MGTSVEKRHRIFRKIAKEYQRNFLNGDRDGTLFERFGLTRNEPSVFLKQLKIREVHWFLAKLPQPPQFAFEISIGNEVA